MAQSNDLQPTEDLFMSAAIAATLFTANYSRSVAQSIEDNQVDVLVLTPSQYMSILQDKTKNNPRLEFTLKNILANSTFGKYWNQTFSPNVSQPWVGPVSQGANDVYMISKTLNAIGMAGITTYVKTTATGTYIVIKGYSVQRSGALQGTRYLASHPKMLQLGLGMKSLQGVAKGGFALGLVVSSGIEVADFLFNDEKTMYDLVGGIGVEAVKGGLGALIAYGFAAALGTATMVAITPLVVMAVVAIVAGVALNDIDTRFGIKNQVISALKATPETISQGMYRIDTTAKGWRRQLDGAAQTAVNELVDWLCPICGRR